ncbi:potassium/proton antiporter [Ilumatobacter nonamiensis]|uniref:potassium/proton antiporter n=1 Tax=Ilumatobacter nonamiensis TaxID=467093 RepID=UPI000349C13F|nr:potassium/proton antiporter [Ilumatobacter nonamiensis]
MSSGFSVDPGVLLGGVLLLVGVLASRIAMRFRIPSLLLFLGLGMLVADDGLAVVRFDDAALAQNIATAALVIILFEGGLGTEPAAFRKVGVAAGSLATIGVVATAGVVALVSWTVLDLDPTTALLLGSVVASTDAAAVFAALRTEPLPRRDRWLLQLESGLNDPVAVLLTIGMVEVWRGDPSAMDWTRFLGLQLGAGLLVGLTVGWLGRRLMSRLTGPAASSLGVITLALAAISYGGAAVVGGSGFLAVYLTGVVLAGSRRSVRGVLFFHEGLAATAQGVLFLLLGILVFPSRLPDNLGTAIVVALALIFVARPVAVALVMVWSRTPARRIAVLSWAGLRGAVPVVLATIPFTAGHPDGALIFDVAFVVVVLSVAVQGPTVGAVARRLGVVAEHPEAVRPEIVPVDALDADLIEVTLPPRSRVSDSRLRDAPLPDGARVAVLRRGDETVVPDGDTVLTVDDVLLVVTPKRCELDDIEHWAAADDDDEASSGV